LKVFLLVFLIISLFLVGCSKDTNVSENTIVEDQTDLTEEDALDQVEDVLADENEGVKIGEMI
jgi:thioredoxin-related protein